VSPGQNSPSLTPVTGGRVGSEVISLGTDGDRDERDG
jgi:hypothetical protein